jgi:F-type H+-transporting ATPase subunit delta
LSIQSGACYLARAVSAGARRRGGPSPRLARRPFDLWSRRLAHMVFRIDTVADGQVQGSEAALRYAQAAFDLAKDAGALDAVAKDLKTVNAAFGESADLRLAASSPMIAIEDKARAFAAIAAKLGLSKLGANLVGVAVQNGRAKDLPAIADSFAALFAAHRGVKPVEVISATPLSQTELDAILAGVREAIGGAVETVAKVDPDLIGGFIVRIGSRQYDASLKSKLESLRRAMKAA